jgi:hypothetical protein
MGLHEHLKFAKLIVAGAESFQESVGKLRGIWSLFVSMLSASAESFGSTEEHFSKFALNLTITRWKNMESAASSFAQNAYLAIPGNGPN